MTVMHTLTWSASRSSINICMEGNFQINVDPYLPITGIDPCATNVEYLKRLGSYYVLLKRLKARFVEITSIDVYSNELITLELGIRANDYLAKRLSETLLDLLGEEAAISMREIPLHPEVDPFTDLSGQFDSLERSLATK